MILTKNKLKNKKVKVDEDEDRYMNFLRFKHLMDRTMFLEKKQCHI